MNEKRKGAALLMAGVMLAVVSIAGVFAAVVDTAKSGQLSIQSAEVPEKDIDLKIDPVSRDQSSSVDCGTVGSSLVDDATTPYITITNASPGAEVIKDFCVENQGTDDALITMDLVEAADIEVGACSTTETGAGDTTCADGAAGELANYIKVGVKVHGALNGTGAGDRCDGDFNHPEVVLPAVNTTSAATPLGWTSVAGLPTNTLTATDEACVQVRLTYDASTPEAQKLLAQTDKVSVRLRFNGE